MKKNKNSTGLLPAKRTAKLGSNDRLINQDFPGYPHAPASKNIIRPVTKTDRKVADVNPEKNKRQ